MITTNRQPCKLATGLQVWLVSFTQSRFVHVVYSCKHKNYVRQSYAGSKIRVKYWPHNLFYNQSRRIL